MPNQSLGQIYKPPTKLSAEESAAGAPKEVKIPPKSPEEIINSASKFVDPKAQEKLGQPGLGYGFKPADIKPMHFATVDTQDDKKLPASDIKAGGQHAAVDTEEKDKIG